MILFYYRELRRQIERLEEQYLPKPTILVYLEALDENGEPWNIVGPNYYWFRDDNNPNDKPPPIPDPGGERVDQSPRGAHDGWDMPEPATPPVAQDGNGPDLPPFGHNQSSPARVNTEAGTQVTGQPPTPEPGQPPSAG